MPRYGVPDPYEKLKEFTRGRAVSQESMQSFVHSIEGLPQEAKESLAALMPSTYIGNAAQQIDGLEQQIKRLLQ